MAEEKKTTMKKTLGLTGVTVNAMALIAPGAFLWITFQVQASNNGGATDMWTGIVAALIVAFLTAIAFSELARKYPEAGAGGSYYFAENDGVALAVLNAPATFEKSSRNSQRTIKGSKT